MGTALHLVRRAILLTLLPFLALERIQEGRRRCQQGGRGEAQGDRGRRQEAGRQGCGGPNQGHDRCEAYGAGEDCAGIELDIFGFFVILLLRLLFRKMRFRGCSSISNP
jgi:hypothetical protein